MKSVEWNPVYIREAGLESRTARVADKYGKPFYYLLCKVDILYVISDILYRI